MSNSFFSLKLFILLKGKACYLIRITLLMQETQEIGVQSLGWDNPLENGMAAHSSILVLRITWTEEPGGLQSIELQRVAHD